MDRIDYEKMTTYVFDIESMKMSTESDLKANWFFIKNLFVPTLSKDRQIILINSIVNRKMLSEIKHVVIYRPDYFALKLDDLNFADFSGNRTHLEALLVGLIDIYMSSDIEYSDIRMRWLINTLIHHKVLTNVFDPANKTSNTFKELFELE